jgi:hypothetical protein
MQNILLFLSLLLFWACGNTASIENNTTKNEGATASIPTSPEFNAYWYAGKAELCRYDLEQARYGETREGNAVLIFVTEPFSKSKQVKIDNPDANPSDVTQVLKVNFTKKFDTGIYPYSVMTSAFTPVDVSQKTIKITSSMQEWCGHVFTQLNLKGQQYVSNIYSYFESEGDKKAELGNVISEDGIWTNLRINPSSLPVGKISMIPSLSYLRFSHNELKAYEATASISSVNFNQKAVSQYFIHYDKRDLKIYFDPKPPYLIEGWEETYSDFGKPSTSRGTLKKVLLSDYWSHHSHVDDAMREAFYK